MIVIVVYILTTLKVLVDPNVCLELHISKLMTYNGAPQQITLKKK